jgi:predicted nucleotidyltransferase
MAMISLPKDLKEFLALLNSHQVEYLLIGGYAVGYHGYPRATGDMDIWVGVSAENARKLVTVLKEFGFDLPEVDKDLFLQRNKIVRMGNAPLRIELLTSISGVEFESCYNQRISDILDDIPVNIIDLQNLIVNKRKSGRFKDLDDVEKLSQAKDSL